MFQPVIKWSGSKRSQAEQILSYFPKEINTYYEPFCGGASVLRMLLESDIKVNHYLCSDINSDLIQMWNFIKLDPQGVVITYRNLWNELNKDNDIKRQRALYEKIRFEYNTERSPLQFIFLNRTCFNGLIRYNSNGEFNSPFHLNRPGIHPDKFEKIVFEWHGLLKKYCVTFKRMNYKDISSEDSDFMYLDPPYANTKGMYNGEFNNKTFFKWLERQPCGYVLSYDGKSGNEDNTYNVPENLYNEHVYLKSGNSSFKRIKEVNKDAMVYESLYIRKK